MSSMDAVVAGFKNILMSSVTERLMATTRHAWFRLHEVETVTNVDVERAPQVVTHG